MSDHTYPVLQPVGIAGLLITFANQLSEPANRAALAFRQAVVDAALDGVQETSTSLTSAFIRFDPLTLSLDHLSEAVQSLLSQQDWYSAPLPKGRRLWRVPTVYGTDLAPQLDDVAAAAGMSSEAAIQQLGASRVRVLTIGFAPGQPYLGPLGPGWDIPRLRDLTPRVPEGALVLAIRQFVLFSAPTPTGWRHVGQTAFRCFRSENAQPFALNPGDEMLFEPVSRDMFQAGPALDPTGNGGAMIEEIAT